MKSEGCIYTTLEMFGEEIAQLAMIDPWVEKAMHALIRARRNYVDVKVRIINLDCYQAKDIGLARASGSPEGNLYYLNVRGGTKVQMLHQTNDELLGLIVELDLPSCDIDEDYSAINDLNRVLGFFDRRASYLQQPIVPK